MHNIALEEGCPFDNASQTLVTSLIYDRSRDFAPTRRIQ